MEDSVKINLLKDFQGRTDEFELNTEKLIQKSRKLLNQRKGVENKIQIVFNGFLESARDGLAVTSVGFYYSPKGGWEEIIIFKKNFEEWKLTDRIKTVYY